MSDADVEHEKEIAGIIPDEDAFRKLGADDEEEAIRWGYAR